MVDEHGAAPKPLVIKSCNTSEVHMLLLQRRVLVFGHSSSNLNVGYRRHLPPPPPPPSHPPNKVFRRLISTRPFESLAHTWFCVPPLLAKRSLSGSRRNKHTQDTTRGRMKASRALVAGVSAGAGLVATEAFVFNPAGEFLSCHVGYKYRSILL